MTTGIVILNYLAYKDTIECISSIKKQTYQDYHIVVVDNDSKNESFDVLSTLYSSDETITLIKNDSNLGFAKGNNVGIACLKQKSIFNVFVINGDTVLKDKEYLSRLVKTAVAPNIGMIGTTIVSRDGKNQNTLPVSLNDKNSIKMARIQIWLMNLLVKTNLLGLVKTVVSKTRTYEKVTSTESNSSKNELLNPKEKMLHGAAIYFTENYLKRHIGFYPDTFLYYEEEFLALICRKLNFKQLYVPEIKIYHKEDASSNLLHKTSRKSLLFKLDLIKKNLSMMERALEMPTYKIAEKVSLNEQ